MPAWAAEQPKDGQHVVHCGHVGRGALGLKFYWYSVTGVEMGCPHGQASNVDWIVICMRCHAANGDDPMATPPGGCFLRVGNEPFIPAAD